MCVIAREWRPSGMRGQLNKSAKSLIRTSIAAEMPNEIRGEGNKLRINYRERGSYNTSSKVANATLDSSSGGREEARCASEALAFLPDFITRRILLYRILYAVLWSRLAPEAPLAFHSTSGFSRRERLRR